MKKYGIKNEPQDLLDVIDRLYDIIKDKNDIFSTFK